VQFDPAKGTLKGDIDGMDTLAISISVAVNTAVSVVLMFHYRRQVRRRKLDDDAAKRRYSWASFGSGFLAAIAVFSALVGFLDVPTGHGEILIAVPILNAGLSVVLLFVGRTAIRWKPLR
jgi:hypothetical protein